jgi:isoleucyl-tRNA synthetase
LVLSLRKKERLKVRQPLHKIIIPVLSEEMQNELMHVENIIKSEVNIKEIEYLSADNQLLVKNIKPNFKTLGKKLGQNMKALSEVVATFTQEQIRKIESNKSIVVLVNGAEFELLLEDVELTTKDMPGWTVASDADTTVALDLTITDDLLMEGIAREFVNRVQNLRKELDFEVTDRISIDFKTEDTIKNAIKTFNDYICNEVLADEIRFDESITSHEMDVYEKAVFLKLSKK